MAHYQTALSQVTFTAGGGQDPSTTARSISFVVRDTSLTPSVAVSQSVSVTAVNNAPGVSVPAVTQQIGFGSNLTFNSNNNNLITVSDVDADSGNEQLTLSVTGGTLMLSTLTGLTGSGNGTASLTYTGTLAAINTALNGLIYTAPSPASAAGPYSLTVGINDQGSTGTGGAHSASGNVAITVLDHQLTAPTVTPSGGTASFTEGSGGATVDTGITAADTNFGTLASATVTISGSFNTATDTLTATNIPVGSGITQMYNAATGVLTLSGSSSAANYTTALQSVSYNNSSQNPTNFNPSASRTVTFVVSDGPSTSLPANVTVNVLPVNTAPTISYQAASQYGGTQSVPLSTAHVFSNFWANGISVADVGRCFRADQPECA